MLSTPALEKTTTEVRIVPRRYSKEVLTEERLKMSKTSTSIRVLKAMPRSPRKHLLLVNQ
jgi:hypothetical protein